MNRRKLVTITIIYIAGIASGYFIFEKNRPAEAACFMIACVASLHFSELQQRDKRTLTVFLIAGFLIFAMHFAVNEIRPPETGDDAPGVLRQTLYHSRDRFVSYFDEETGSFIKGVIFGDKSDIDDEIINEFNNNQTGHILAVSGLHIGFLYSLLRFLTGKKRTRTVSAMIILVLMLYGEMTAWSAPNVRACIVLSINLLAVHFRRKADLLTSVSLAAFLILSFDPYQLFEAGFQMSMLAMTSIAILTKPVSMKLGETLGMIIAVQAGILPVTAFMFCRANPVSILINVPIVLLASVLVPVCIVLLVFELVFGRVPQPGIKLADLIADTVLRVNHILNFDGDFSINVAGVGLMGIICFYVAVFGLASEWVRIMAVRKDFKAVSKAAVLILMPLLMLYPCIFDRLSDDEILFPYVGQGDCVHIRAGRHDMLIDGGGNERYSVGEKILLPYLLRSGADSLDIALVTHLHTDHYRGICELSELYHIDTVGIPSDYRDAKVDIKNSRIVFISPESKVSLTDDVVVSAIWPVEESPISLTEDDENEHNMVYMVSYKGIKVMVTGDLLEEDELEMLEYYRHKNKLDMLKCDVLKVAHHGSKSSSSEAFLDAASPLVAVISVGKNNVYGHPHDQTMERLRARNILTVRTDINGNIGIDIRGNKIIVDTSKT